MRNARLVSSHFPYLPTELKIGLQTANTEALVDTGFDGDVVVPMGFIHGGLPAAGRLPWALADHSEVSAPAYLGTIRLGELGAFAIVITVLGGEPIIGRNVTNRFKMTLDHGQQLVVEL